jgi:hypothetical protein
VLLLASVAFADPRGVVTEDSLQHVFPGGIGLPGPLQATCNDIIPPATPVTGEVLYCKAGSGWCAKDSGGTERCTGAGGGGGGGTVTQLNAGTGITLTPNPIVNTGTVAATPHALLDGTINNDTLAGAPVAGNLVLSNATPAWASVAMSGDVTISATGATTIGAAKVTDADLANAYSGVGACAASKWASTLTRNAAPTCTQPAFSDISGVAAVGQLPSLAGDVTGAINTNTVAKINGATLGTTTATDKNILIANGAQWQTEPVTGDITLSDLGAVSVTRLNSSQSTTSEAANLVYAGPTSGAAAAPTFRTLVSADIPGGLPTAFSAITSGTNTQPAHMTVGNGSQLDFSGSGTVTASDVVCTTCINLTSEVSGVLPVANGGTNLSTATDDNVMVGNGTTWQSKAVPLTTAAGSVLQYDTVANNFLNHTLALSDLPNGTFKDLNVGGSIGGLCNLVGEPPTPVINVTTQNSIKTSTSSCGGNSVTVNLSQNMASCKGAGESVNYNSSTDTWTCQDANPTRADLTAGVDCTGATDSTTGFQNALNALTATNSTIFLPSGCVLRFKSPGTVNPAITIPQNNIHILCADETAGFAVNRQTCHNGTYPGAACNTSAECTGGGTCQDDFGNAAANPCTATTCFAPTGASTYTLMKDTAGGNDTFIENCSFFLAQASPYQVCTGGASAGNPCRQECDNASTTPGLRCETNADCGAGVCLRTADCHAGVGTCGGLPSKVPSGPGNIRAIDFTRTTRTHMRHVAGFDALTSDFSVQTGPFSLIEDVDLAREGTDCTSPIIATPSASTCFGATTGGQCCYGALFNNTISSGNKGNTQPANAVTQQLIVGHDSQVLHFTKARGTTAFTGSGTDTRFDETVVKPYLVGADGTTNLGPGGNSTNGWSVGDHGQVTKSYALNLAGSGTCINLTSSDSGAVADKCDSKSGALSIGINMNGANSHAIGNNLKGFTGAGVGVKATSTATYAGIDTNYIESAATTGIGIELTGDRQTASSNHIVSNAVDQLNVGIKTDGSSVGESTITGNKIIRPTKACVWLNSTLGTGFRVDSNVCDMTTATTSSLQPACAISDGTFTQQSTFSSNFCVGGWRDVTGNSFTNINIVGNRFYANQGAAIAVANAGVNVQSNYFNQNATWTTSCDLSCAGGAPVTRGIFCNQDTDCTAGGNTCNASVFKCNPEPLQGYLGDATSNSPNVHPSWVGNLMFNNQTAAMKQCTVAGAIGQKCDVASCNGGATCSGTPQTCQSGADSGKFCCQTAAGATCAVRTPTAHLIVPDYGASQTTITNGMIADNIFFGGTAGGNYVAIDFVRSASLGNIKLTTFSITNNSFSLPDNTGNVYIKLPSVVNATFGNLFLTGNQFTTLTSGVAPTNYIVNYQGSMGPITLVNGKIANFDFPTLTTAAQTLFSGMNQAQQNTTEANTVETIMPGSGTIWKMTCQIHDTPTNTSTRAFTLRQNHGDTAMTCTITNAIKQCTTAAGAASAPIAFAAGDQFDMKQVSVVGTALAATQGTCVAYASFDTVM